MVVFTEYAFSEHNIYPGSGNKVLMTGAPDLTPMYLQDPEGLPTDPVLAREPCLRDGGVVRSDAYA